MSESEKEPYPEEKIPQTEAKCSINYVLIDIDKESDELKMFEEFEENPSMQDISENSVELPSEDYLEFRPKIVKDVLEKLDQEGFDTLVAIAKESNKEEKKETTIVIRKKRVLHTTECQQNSSFGA